MSKNIVINFKVEDEKKEILLVKKEPEKQTSFCDNDSCLIDRDSYKRLYNVGKHYQFCRDCCEAMARHVAKHGI